MPRPKRSWSLVRRLTGGVALIALLSFVAQAVVLVMWLSPVAADAAVSAAEQALQVRVALEAVPPADRPALAHRLSSPWVAVSRDEPADHGDGTLRPPAEFEVLTEMLRHEGVTVRIEPRGDDGAMLLFRLPVANEVWWLSRTVTRPASALSRTLALWLVMLAAATTGALLVSVRLIARPLGDLARQLAAQQGTLRPLPLRDDASAELRSLVQAFNALAHQVTAAGQARQQLLAGVSHDLRTPLARLRLRAETQCEPALGEALTADLLALERIVNQFLAYVQGDSSAALGEPAPLDESVRSTVERYAAAGEPVHLQRAAADQPMPDVAVQRLLSNLIDNALAYGGGRVDVALEATGDGAELRVSDDGPGMNAEEFERAQQPFVRLTRTRSELGHCGLGLAIVAQTTRQLGGQLQAGRGDDGRFRIVLHLPRHVP